MFSRHPSIRNPLLRRRQRAKQWSAAKRNLHQSRVDRSRRQQKVVVRINQRSAAGGDAHRKTALLGEALRPHGRCSSRLIATTWIVSRMEFTVFSPLLLADTYLPGCEVSNTPASLDLGRMRCKLSATMGDCGCLRFRSLT